MSTQRSWAIAAGVLAGLIFGLAVSGLVPSALLIYLPYLCLLMAGLALGEKETLLANSIACGLVLIAAGMGGVLMFATMFSFPVIYFSLRALTRQGRYRPSIGRIMTGMTYYVALLVAVFALLVQTQMGGFEQFLPAPEGEETPMAELVRQLLTEQTFLFLGASAWAQLLVFYGLAVLANYLLTGWGVSRRESMAIRPFMPSAGLLLGLLGAGLVSFIDDASASLIGRTTFIILLFPYFLMGISKLHRKVRDWKNRRFTLILVYLSLCLPPLMPYLVLGFVGMGLLSQGRYLSNRFGGTDS